MRAVDAIYSQLRPVILLALSALIPIILLCGVIALHFVREQRVELDKIFQDKAMTLAMALSRELETQINLLAILSETPRLDPPVSVQGFSEVTRRLQARLPLWNIIRVSDLNGTILVSVPPTNMAPGARVVDIGSHDKVVNTGKPTVGDMVKGPAGNLAFAVRVPVIRGDRTISILSVVIQSSALDALIKRSGLPENWMAWITDGKDQVVVSSDPQFIGKPGTDFIQYTEQNEGGIRSGVLFQGLDVRVSDATIETSAWTVHVAMPLSDYRILSWKVYSLFAATLFATLVLSAIGIYLFQRELETRRRQEAAFESSQRLQALGKLTGQVAHDFNNLLMVFQAGTNAISRRLGDQDERLKLIFDSMFDGVARGKEMTQRLLSFSRRSDQGSKPIDLVRALRELEPLLRQLANDSVVLQYEIDPRLWPVVADPKALEIAMVNLVTNAREAMPSGGVVTVRASNLADVSGEVRGLTGAFVAIAVSDTGSGMKPTLTSKAFDPLFSTKGPGAAGLGLTQVLTFAERSGGTAKLVSVEDVGTAVTLYLPRSLKELEEEPTDTVSAALPKRVLIVDDTPSSLISTQLSLEEDDIEILTAGSGTEALRILAQDKNIDLLLSDIMMPGMSGIELARETAHLSEDITILLMTGFSDQLEQGVKIDFPVLMKPFSQAELRAALKRTVRGKSGQA